jgi:outer membrane protein OmpA-like peptidoglycan-associated protein
MKKLLFILLSWPLLQSCMPLPSGGYGNSSDTNSGNGSQYPSQQTPAPSGSGRSADPNISVEDIRLSGQYTVLYVSFINNNSARRDQSGRVVDDGSQEIAFHPSARLVGANGAREFRFVKAEGIPVEPQRKKTYAGTRTNFVVYFERLDPGIESFDLFECNDYDHLTCWNVYGLYVKNPSSAQVPTQQVPNQSPNYPSQTPSIPAPTSQPNTPTKKPKSGKVGEVDTTPQQQSTEPSSVLVVGIVRDAKTNRPISATIDFTVSGSNKKIDSTQSFASTGIYRMNLKQGQVYTYVAHAKGYLAANDFIDLSKSVVNNKLTKDILLNPIQVGDKITLKNIYFEVSKSDLLPASFAELNKLVSMMDENQNLEIRLEGHTDIVGDPEANQELSEERVINCKEYLIKKGISANRIQAVGYGSTKPIIKKGTDEERKVNRRVEFVILKL